MSFSSLRTVHDDTEPQKTKFHVCDDKVLIPPRASMFVAVKCGNSSGIPEIAAANMPLVLGRQVCVARGLIEVIKWLTELSVSNFGYEHQRLTSKTRIACLEELGESSGQDLLSEITELVEATASIIKTDVNPNLSFEQKCLLETIINSCRNSCFNVQGSMYTVEKAPNCS